MAKKKGGAFQRFLELVLDKQSAAKTERDTQAALKRATDPKVVAGNLASFAKDAARITAQAAAAVVGYAVALTQLTERGGKVLTVQRAFAAAVGDTEAALATLRKATHGLISDYDLMVGFNRALTLGAVKTVDQFAEMSDVALRLGRALGVDAAFAMESLTLGIGRGSKLILDNLGIIVEGAVNVDTVMEAARQTIARLGGDAATNADLLGRVKTQFTNIKDEVAKFLAQSDALRTAFFEVGNVLETIVLALQSKDRDTMVEAFKLAGSLAGTAFASAMLDAVRAGFRAISDLITPGFLENKAQFIPVLGVFKAVADLAGVAADSGWSTVNALIAQGDALRGQLQTERELQALRGPVRLDQSLTAGAPGTGTSGCPGQPEVGPVSGADLDGQSEGAEKLLSVGTPGLGGVGIPLFDLTAQAGSAPPPESPLTTFLLDNFDEIQSAAQTAALGMRQAFTDAFLTIGVKSQVLEELEAERLDRMADATTEAQRKKVNEWYEIERANAEALDGLWETMARGFAASILTGIAQVAAAKVGENIAKALAATGEGLLGHPGGFPAAGSFLAAAAGWAALGGVAGAAASSVGGSGASSFRGSDVVGRQIDKLDRAGGDIIIHIDGVDPSNPRHQALVGQTARQYQERYGGRVVVNPARKA